MSKYDEIDGYYDEETKGKVHWILAIMLFLITIILISFITYFSIAGWHNKTDHIYKCNERYHAMKKSHLDLKLKADFEKNCNDSSY